RFGPYFSSRFDASVTPRPSSVLVASFFTASSTGIAYQATTSLAPSAIVGLAMIGLRIFLVPRTGQRLGCYAVRPENSHEIRWSTLTGLNRADELDRGPIRRLGKRTLTAAGLRTTAMYFIACLLEAPVAQLDRAPDFESGGQ